MIILIILIAILSYREVQILVDRGDWNADHFWIKFWYIDWTSEWKDFDSFHVLMGLATIFIILWKPDKVINWYADIIIYWFMFYYLRNVFMHIIYKRKLFREWEYIIPVLGKLLKPLFAKRSKDERI